MENGGDSMDEEMRKVLLGKIETASLLVKEISA
jgi:hypothetical protein